ncbi:peptidoglycan-binding protein [Haloimpatiens sp. FM7330]|uniref:peptidoglycan-binding protein n=1 Tax=Haloimpatiens sp. FM7330 TaxID=3298610 RepID=UPI0036367BE9
MLLKGRLQVQVFKGDSYIPIDNAKVTIIQTEIENNIKKQRDAVTNSCGLTNEFELEFSNKENSIYSFDDIQYGLCDIKVEAQGFSTMTIKDCKIYSDNIAFQVCNMKKNMNNNRQDKKSLKYTEEIDKLLSLRREEITKYTEPEIPEFIVVHYGLLEDDTAPNYVIKFKDYIKNVACCEICPKWPEECIKAITYCITSFTLNRVYTRWYRRKGKQFDITNDAAHDLNFSYGRNTYKNIDKIVDETFSTYIKYFNRKQPILAQFSDKISDKYIKYLDKKKAKYLGDNGKNVYEILTKFYGNDIEFVTASKIEGISKSYPGYVLQIGCKSNCVRTIQKYLNSISLIYPSIGTNIVEGVYDDKLKKQVFKFQEIFNLTNSGKVDYATWYKISEIYSGVSGSYRFEKNIEFRKFTPPYIGSKNNVPSIVYPED